jgi:Glycosyl transferases group 1
LRILVIKGHSQYGGTRLFADHAAAAFARRGFEVGVLDLAAIIDAGGDAPAAILADAAAQPADLVFSINIVGEYKDPAGRSLAAIHGAPHVVWHTDYVLTNQARLEGTPASTAVLVVDPTQVDAIRSVYGVERFDRLRFFPHPAVGEPAPDDADADAFAAARPIPLLWSGGFQKPDAEPPWAGAPGPARAVFDDALDLALSVEWMPPLQALETVLAARGLDLADPANRGAKLAAPMIDAEVRWTRRFEFLKAVAKSGVAVHICGANWEGQLYRFKNATYEGPVEMSRMVELMRRSRLVLNTNGNFGAGSHERPFSASLAGAATFSDFSRYYDQVFEDGRSMAMFRWKDLDAGMGRLAALAADPAACFAMAREAKALTLRDHTWDRRIDPILEAAGI